jgi:hypothetical protein
MDYFLDLIPKRAHKVIKLAELVCLTCGRKFSVPFWMLKKGRKFCSSKCKNAPPMVRLLAKVSKAENGCWNYTGTIGWGGYGQIKANGTNYGAHKLMWILWNKRQVPSGLVVRHTCIGNTKCINPDHLILGTQKDNIQDCIAQGRFKIVRGERRGNAKLTDDVVRKIREMRSPNDGSKPVTFKELSRQFNASYSAVWFAANKKQWAHVV